MKQFDTIEKLDTAILYILELVSSISVLLLAFGLIASVANILTQGSILTGNVVGQELYAWTQAIGIDAAIPGVMIRLVSYAKKREWFRVGVYTVLSLLVLFTAYNVSNIEAIQQTLHLSLDGAYTLGSFVPVQVLVNIRSLTVVLIIVAHAIRHVPDEEAVQRTPVTVVNPVQEDPHTVVEEETQQEEKPKQLPSPTNENFQKVKT